MSPRISDFNLPPLPDSPDMPGQLSRYLSDTLAQAAGLEIEPTITDPSQVNIQIESWQDWVRLIAGFKSLADWHKQAWRWAWSLKFGVYQSPFVVIAPRGGGKSSSAEGIIAAVGARGTRKYVLYVRATQAQANSSIANIANILENSAIKDYYPAMGQRLISAFGQSKAWNRQMLRTASGFTVAAFGLDSALRGSKVDDYRPDLICHQVGTQIYDPTLERWCKVEDHPGLLTLRHGPGLKVIISGAPDPEVVTPEHKYWARMIPEKAVNQQWNDYDPEPKWIEAKNLQASKHYIGLPIDQVQLNPQPIKARQVVQPNAILALTAEVQESMVTPPEFYDPEWWWFFGLWWRTGGFDQDGIYISFAAGNDTRTAQRLMDLLQRYDLAAERRQERRVDSAQRRSSYHILFRHGLFFRWLRTWTNILDSKRVPPWWVEQLSHPLQRALVLGYFNDDYHTNPKNAIRIIKERDDDLLSVRRICARIGIPAIVYRNKRSTKRAYTQEEYTFYARDNVRDVLGLNVDSSKAPYTNAFIRDGYLWSRITAIDPVSSALFAPITTKTHTYYTNFGLSHNCLDDIDEKHDSPGVTRKKIDTITTSILPAGSTDMTVLAIQNKILDDGIFASLAEGTADFLADRILVGPIPAVEGLKYVVINNIPKIVEGTATWDGQSLEVCEQQMRTWGVRAFLAEAQHETSMPEGGTFEGLTYTRMAEDDVPDLASIVCWIDPAVSTTTRSDCQAIQIDGIERIADPRKRPRIFRLYSWEGIDKPSNAIKRALREGCARHVQKIGIETNQGGDLWEDEYLTIAGDMLDAGEIEYIPTFDSAKAGAHTGSKEDRAGRMLTDYTRNYFVHVYGTHDTLEQALGRFPHVAPDDLVDAAYWSWYDLRSKDKYRGKPRYVRIERGKLFSKDGNLRGNTRASHLRRLGLRR